MSQFYHLNEISVNNGHHHHHTNNQEDENLLLQKLEITKAITLNNHIKSEKLTENNNQEKENISTEEENIDSDKKVIKEVTDTGKLRPLFRCSITGNGYIYAFP